MGVKLFAYWDTGYDGMPRLLQFIHDHNARMCKKFDLEFVFLSDANISEWIDIPSRYNTLAANHKSDIIRFFALHKYGGVWLDTDGLVLKDLNVVYKALLDSGKDAIFDKDMYDHYIIGCASLIMLPNTETTKLCISKITETLASKEIIQWSDIGPCVSSAVYYEQEKHSILNNMFIAGQCVNFVCWNYYPGYNRDKWYLPTEEKARNTAQQIFKSSYSYFTLTWTIYNKNTIPGDLVDFVFRDKRSVYTHLIELACQPI